MSTPTTVTTMLVEGPVTNFQSASLSLGNEGDSLIASQIEAFQEKIVSLQNQLQDNTNEHEDDYEQLAFVSLSGDLHLFNNGNWQLSGIWKSVVSYNGRMLYRHSIHEHLCMCWTPKMSQWRIKSTLKSPVARAVLRDDIISPELSSSFWYVYSNDTKQFEASGKFRCFSLDQPTNPIAGPTWLDLKHGLESNRDGVCIPKRYQQPLLQNLKKYVETNSTLNGTSGHPWLEGVLKEIVSHAELKTQIRKFYYSLEFMTERVRRSQRTTLARPAQHMVFLGNPGTGKTMLARIMGNILQKSGILSSGHVVEVQRGDLVAGFVGQTALKTRKKIKEAEGGVLFVDEAYRLFSANSNNNDYGMEAVDEIMSVLDEQADIVIILAGYPDHMRDLLDANPGLCRRFPHVFRFSDYTTAEIVAIFDKKLQKAGFSVDGGFKLESLFQLKFSPLFISKRNGGLCDQLLVRCREALAFSLHGKCHGASDRQLNTFTKDIFVQAIDTLVQSASGFVSTTVSE